MMDLPHRAIPMEDTCAFDTGGQKMPMRSLILSSVVAILFLATPSLAQKAPDPVAPEEPGKPGDTAPGLSPAPPAPTPGIQPVAPLPTEPTVVPAPAPEPTAQPTPLPGEPTDGDLAQAMSGALGGIGERLAPGDLEDFTAALAEAPAGVNGNTIGHFLYIQRHVLPAAWFFGTEALQDPESATTLSNFSAMLLEAYLLDPAAPQDWPGAAYLASSRAVTLDPGGAVLWNNLGNAARALGLTDEAVLAGERATALDPEERLFWTNLARSRAAAGNIEGAAAALARAHQITPNDPAVRLTAHALSEIAGPYGQELQRQCNVDLRCDLCPGSIVGQLLRVQCEMENSSAQMACQAGEIYPTTFNCEEQFPEYGILIPGLNSGFSVLAPGFTGHVLVNGDGTVRVQVEVGITRGRLGGYVRATGSWSPSNGASFDDLTAGVRVNILPTSMGGGGTADQTAGNLGHSPIQIEAETGGPNGPPVEIGVEAFNGAGRIGT